MAVIENDMSESALIIGIVVVSLASIVSLIFAAIFCAWCFGSPPDEESLDEDVSKYNYLSIPQQENPDVKLLKKHSWRDRIEKKSTHPHFLTRKTIKFMMPEKKVVTENVQPDTASQTSLNDKLGVRKKQQSLDTESIRSQESDQGFLSGILGTKSESSYSNTNSHGASASAHLDIESPFNSAAPTTLGRLKFQVNYDYSAQTLSLKILSAERLPAKDWSGTSDPYVKILLLPDRKNKVETKVKRKCLNPRWNEIFLFEGYPHSKLENRALYLQVLDYDRFSRDDPIGELIIPIGEIPNIGQAPTFNLPLQPCSENSTSKRGELLLSLCYQPTVGRITVVIIKARELKAQDITGYSDPYVKLWLMYQGKKIEKKKTEIKMRNLNPVYNESFIFQVPYEKIRETTIHISVYDWDRMSRNDLIGQFVLGSKSGPMEVKHWNDMLSKPRQQVAQWHILRN